MYVNFTYGVFNNAPIKAFNLVACLIAKSVALAVADAVQLMGEYQLCCVPFAACVGGLKAESSNQTCTNHTHWVSNSSSETSSMGTVRVLLARTLLILVPAKRLVMPARVTPVPSRFT